MAGQRITLVNSKMSNVLKRNKKEIAKLLEIGKEEKARIKVEHVIRDDFTMEAHELLELLCETLVARLPLIVAEKQCPYDIINTVSTIIYCAPRVMIPELQVVRKELIKKYGKEFGERAARNVDGIVNERVIQKLSVQPPNAFLVLNYLKEIAAQYHVNWKPTEPAPSDHPGAEIPAPFEPMPAPTGFSVTPGAGSGFTKLYNGPNGTPGTAGLPVPPGNGGAGGGPGNGAGGFPPSAGGGGGGGGVPDVPLATIVPGVPPKADGFADTPYDVKPSDTGKAGMMGGLPMPPGSAGAGAGGLPLPPGSGGAGAGGLPMPPGSVGGGGGAPSVNDLPMPGSTVVPPKDNVPPAAGGGGAPDFDELTARFNALRGLQ
eukprot:g5862.t1